MQTTTLHNTNNPHPTTTPHKGEMKCVEREPDSMPHQKAGSFTNQHPHTRENTQEPETLSFAPQKRGVFDEPTTPHQKHWGVVFVRA